jgi:plastocyanin
MMRVSGTPCIARRVRQVAAALGAGTCLALAGAALGATTHTVAIEGTRFVPERLEVQRGDRVVWTNRDPFPHTATAKGAFDSGSIAGDRSWTYVADKPGSYAYICTFHPTMKGTLVVH